MRRMLLSLAGGFGLVVAFRLLERRGIAPAHGAVLGIPYDFRLPTAQRIRERLWDPASGRLLTPNVFGIGYSLNFGALARRLFRG